MVTLLSILMSQIENEIYYIGITFVDTEIKNLHEKKISDILDERIKWNLPLLEKNASVQSVLSILTARDHIWVVEEKKSKKVVGVITEYDILRLLAPARLPKYVFGKKYGVSIEYGTAKKAEDVMCKQVIKCSPDEKVGDVLSRMVNAGLRRLPVIENDEIVGEITAHYIIQILLGKR